MGRTIKPFSAEDCIDFINNHLNEIENKEYILQINYDWIASLPKHILSFLAIYSDLKSKIMIAENFLETPIDILEILAKDSCSEVRSEVAKNPKTTESILRVLAEDENIDVRRAVAYHNNTSSDTLRKLSIDSDQLINKYIAENPHTPSDILEPLARDPKTRTMVSSNPNIPSSMIDKLLKDPELRRHVASNPKTSPEVLKKLTKENDYNVLLAVAGNPTTSIAILEKLASYSDGSDADNRRIKEAIARNPTSSTTLLKKLVKDSYYYASRNDHHCWHTYGHLAMDHLKKRGINYKWKKSCFIATAVYETPNAPEVLILKCFRDEILLRYNFGRIFVNFYYQIGPHIASLIERSIIVKKFFKSCILKPIVYLINFIQK